MSSQCAKRGFRVAAQLDVTIVDVPVQKGEGECLDVLAVFAQRRRLHPQYVEAVIQIFTEPAMLDRGFEIDVGCREHAGIDMYFFATIPSYRFFLQKNQ